MQWYFNGMKATMDHAGRMVIPKPIREAAGLRPGQPLEVAYRDGRIEIEPPATEVRLIRKGKLLVAHATGAPPLKHSEVNQLLQQVRRRGI
jgi:AbrB family looped-hinge helix DNA binding protein